MASSAEPFLGYLTVFKSRLGLNNLVLGVKDNGVGFREKMKRGHGLGFHIMKYRAQSIGARLELESSKRGGTRVAVYLPLGK